MQKIRNINQNKIPTINDVNYFIQNGLVLIGSHSILNILLKYHSFFEFIVLPQNYNSSKLERLIKIASDFNVRIFFDSKLVKFVSKYDADLTKTNIFAVLKCKLNKYYSLEEILNKLDKKRLTCVAFSEIDYPQNIGAILRTSYAFNVDFILISNRQTDVFNNTITKVSMGANYLLPIVKENFFDAIQKLKSHDFTLIGLDMDGENIQNLLYNNKACFFLGNEETGLSETVKSRMDNIVSIPINEGIESLNVSVAAGIALYDRILKYGSKA